MKDAQITSTITLKYRVKNGARRPIVISRFFERSRIFQERWIQVRIGIRNAFVNRIDNWKFLRSSKGSGCRHRFIEILIRIYIC